VPFSRRLAAPDDMKALLALMLILLLLWHARQRS
jgi:MYXO-CTERM domain-containing protein